MSYLDKELIDGKLQLKNRLVMPPMATAKSTADGLVSEAVIDYYNEKSKGGYIGLIIIEHSYVMKQGKASPNQLSIAQDEGIDKLKQLAEVIHKNGSKAVMQINHAGIAAKETVTGMKIAGPSAIKHPSRNDDEIPAELTTEEIKNVIEAFAKAADRVKKAGFDGVEIHSAHGYLLSQFLSPLTNKRTDEYGGNINGRMKIHLEIIRAVRETVGEEFPIFLRLGAADYRDGGLTIEDSVTAAAEFEEAGVDMLDISGGFCGFSVPGITEPGYFSGLSSEIKGKVKIPVMVTGGITEVKSAEKILAEGKADLIGVGRAIYQDSNWAKQAIEKLK